MPHIKDSLAWTQQFQSQELKKLEQRLSDDIKTEIPPLPKNNDTNHGHRERLKQKFLQSGFIGFHDYEIIELILFYAIPRCDVKPLAKLLLKTFGTIENIFVASQKEIMGVKGCGDTVYFTLKLFSQTSLVISREQLNKAPLLAKWTELSNYLRLKMGYLTHEEFHILFLNAKSYLISDMKIFRGTVDKAAIYPREILKHALECGAVSMILAHNHPSGDATPSHDDIQTTYRIIQAAQLMNITVIDHIIVGKYDVKSFRNLNLL
jgi:DNA repair protein RadC